MSVINDNVIMNIDGREVNFPVNETISHGTLRTEDLVATFESWLECIDPVGYKELMRTKDEDYPEDEWLNEVLFDVMDDYTPDGYYFGALEGDGSNFGFWEYTDDVEEID